MNKYNKIGKRAVISLFNELHVGDVIELYDNIMPPTPLTNLRIILRIIIASLELLNYTTVDDSNMTYILVHDINGNSYEIDFICTYRGLTLNVIDVGNRFEYRIRSNKFINCRYTLSINDIVINPENYIGE